MIMSNKLNVRETEENKRHMHVNGSKKYAVAAINVHTLCTTLNEKSEHTQQRLINDINTTLGILYTTEMFCHQQAGIVHQQELLCRKQNTTELQSAPNPQC